MLCGSVGDGKSHLLSYLNSHHPDLAKKFKIHNDATESFDPSKTSIDTLSEVLKGFNDDNINSSNEKFILAINLGVLNKFIDSDYSSQYSELIKSLEKSNIFDSKNVSQNFEDTHLSIISFSDYNLFTLNKENNSITAKSDFLLSLINKIGSTDKNNPFYNAYLIDKKNEYNSPLILNYSLFCNEKFKDTLINLIIKISLKYKKIISTRDLLNFFYDILVPSEIKRYSDNYTILDSFDELIPNLLFDNENNSDLLRLFKKEDPLDIRHELLDNMIIDLNLKLPISKIMKKYFGENNLTFLKREMINYIDYNPSEIQTISETLIRFSVIFGVDEVRKIFFDKNYSDFLKYLYLFNVGDYYGYGELFKKVKESVFAWKGSFEKNYLIIDMFDEFHAANKLNLKPKKPDSPEIIQNNALTRFKTFITLDFEIRDSNVESLDVDYPLYISLMELINGFKPNKIERKNLIVLERFIESVIWKNKNNVELKIKHLNSNIIFNFEEDDFDGYIFRRED